MFTSVYISILPYETYLERTLLLPVQAQSTQLVGPEGARGVQRYTVLKVVTTVVSLINSRILWKVGIVLPSSKAIYVDVDSAPHNLASHSRYVVCFARGSDGKPRAI